MEVKDILLCVIAICTGLIITIPLVKKFYCVMKENAQNKNWYAFLSLILQDMQAVQQNIQDGKDRKEAVMEIIDINANAVNYPLTDEEKQKLSDMIDALVEMANIVGIRNIKESDIKG